MPKKTKMEITKELPSIRTRTIQLNLNNQEMGVVKSSLNFPQLIKYRGENCFIPPAGKLDNVKKSDLSFPLPAGVKFVSNQK